MKYVLLLVGVLFFAGCATKTTSTQDVEGEFFGEEFTLENVMDHPSLMTQMESAEDTLMVQVEGIVDEVCQAKGCWMNIVSEDGGETEPIFVKFKDYGFFVPKDIAGRTVVMRGKAYKEETPVDELKHYAEDKGEPEEVIAAITEPKVEFKFMADGVLLKNM